MGDYYFRPYPYKITQGDIFLVYAAFQRAVHHFHISQESPVDQKDAFHSDYEEIFKYVKHFCHEKRGLLHALESQMANYHSVLEDLIWFVRNLFMQDTAGFKDLKYSEKYDEFEQEYNKHVEKFPTLTHISNAHVHAVDKHYVTDKMSDLTDLEVCLRFNKDQIVYPFDECWNWWSSLLKETLLDIPPNRRLRWCVRLLMAYHYENECSMFMSSAFKLCLNAVDVSSIAESQTPYELCRTMIWNFDFFKKFRLDVFPYQEKFIERCADYLFFKRSKNFQILLEYGVSYDYSKERLLDLKKWISLEMLRMGRMPTNEAITQKCEYYCLQIFYLHFFKQHPWLKGCPNKVLQAIWASIPEPFLTKGDMHACFSHKANNGGHEWWALATSTSVSDLAEKVYRWYSDAVAAEENGVRSPRSLQHLSRCALRAHLRFPINIIRLDWPQRLKDYVMLKNISLL